MSCVLSTHGRRVGFCRFATQYEAPIHCVSLTAQINKLGLAEVRKNDFTILSSLLGPMKILHAALECSAEVGSCLQELGRTLLQLSVRLGAQTRTCTPKHTSSCRLIQGAPLPAVFCSLRCSIGVCCSCCLG